MFGGLASLNGQPCAAVIGIQDSHRRSGGELPDRHDFLSGSRSVVYGTTHRAIGQVLRHLGLVNWFLAGFNILRVCPLDGGRVLRAALCVTTRTLEAATQLAIRSGLMIAITLIVGGIYSFIKFPRLRHKRIVDDDHWFDDSVDARHY